MACLEAGVRPGEGTVCLSAITGERVAQSALSPVAVVDRRLFAWGVDKQLGIYALPTLEHISNAHIEQASNAVAVSPDGGRAATIDTGGLTWIELDRGVRHSVSSSALPIGRLASGGRMRFSDDGRRIALGSREHIYLHDTERDTWAEATHPSGGHGLHPNNSEMSVLTEDELIVRDPFVARIWNLEHLDRPRDVQLPDGRANHGVFRRTDGALFLQDKRGYMVQVSGS